MSANPLGVLLMAYGTPKSPDDVEAYYTHIRHGRPPTPALLEDLKRRYEAIGGLSPLTQITQAQAKGLEDVLNQTGGRDVKVYLGMKHTHPFIDETVEQMVSDGVTEAVALVLAPHYSIMSVEGYLKTARETAAKLGNPTFAEIKSWHLQDGFIQLLTQRVQSAIEELHKHTDALAAKDGDSQSEATVIFSAHSLPQRILELGDKYPDQLHETGEAVAHKLGLKKVVFAWQSAGRTADPWLGPDILDVLRDLRQQGEQKVVICSAGFVSDHLEVLYDIDIECRQLCNDLGITMVRTESLNADVAFMKVLADLVRQQESEVFAGGK